MDDQESRRQEGERFAKQLHEELQAGQIQFHDQLVFESALDYLDESGRFDIALAIAEAAIEQYPYAARLHVSAARIYFEKGDDKEALDLLQRAQVLDATEHETYALRAEIHMSHGRNHETLDELDRALQYADPNEQVDLYMLKASAHIKLKERKNCLKAFQTALKLAKHPEKVLSHIWLYAAGDLELTVCKNVYEQYIDEQPYSHIAWYYLGQTCFRLGQLHECEEALEYAYITKSDFQVAYLDRSEILLELDLIDKAIDCMQDALAIWKESPEVFFALGRGYEANKEYEKAMLAYKSSLQYDPNNTIATYRLGEIQFSKGEFDQALIYFTAAYSERPSDTMFASAVGRTRFALDQFDLGKEFFQSAIERHDHCVDLIEDYANILVAIGEINACLDMLDSFEEAADDAAIILLKIVCALRTDNPGLAFCLKLLLGGKENYSEKELSSLGFTPEMHKDLYQFLLEENN